MDAWHHVPFLRIEFPLPGYRESTELWRRSLNGDVGPNAAEYAWELAAKFRLSGGRIRDAATAARNLARWRDPEQRHVTTADLHRACRLQSNRNLASLAEKITPHFQWDDIVLPADRVQQLRELCSYVKYRAVVYDAWGTAGIRGQAMAQPSRETENDGRDKLCRESREADAKNGRA